MLPTYLGTISLSWVPDSQVSGQAEGRREVKCLIGRLQWNAKLDQITNLSATNLVLAHPLLHVPRANSNLPIITHAHIGIYQ